MQSPADSIQAIPARIYVFHPEPGVRRELDKQVLSPVGYQVEEFEALNDLMARLKSVPADLVMVADNLDDNRVLDPIKQVLAHLPSCALVLLVDRALSHVPVSYLDLGVTNIIAPPYPSEEVLAVIARALKRRVGNDAGFWQKKAEEAAAQVEEYARRYQAAECERSKYQNLLTSIQDGIVIMDAEQRFVLCNRAAAEFLNLDHNNCRGQRLPEVVDNKDFLATLKEANNRKAFQAEISLDNKRVLNARFTPVPGIGLAIVLHEITQLKNLDQIKSDFVNTVSHDLRSPLTAIMGYVELLDRVGPLNERQQQFVDRILLSAKIITELIDNLLDLGRIEAGFDTQLELITPQELIRSSLYQVAASLEEKGQYLVTNISPDLPTFLGNAIRLQQMLTNLLDNANKYTPEGGKIELLVRQEQAQLIIQVSDSGPGIPIADQPYIFDRFFRASNVAGSTPGTGLGLAIVKSIVDLHHGRVWTESTPGQGSTFTVVLPVRTRAE